VRKQSICIPSELRELPRCLPTQAMQPSPCLLCCPVYPQYGVNTHDSSPTKSAVLGQTGCSTLTTTLSLSADFSFSRGNEFEDGVFWDFAPCSLVDARAMTVAVGLVSTRQHGTTPLKTTVVVPVEYFPIVDRKEGKCVI
jgi:hypothetical protein